MSVGGALKQTGQTRDIMAACRVRYSPESSEDFDVGRFSLIFDVFEDGRVGGDDFGPADTADRRVDGIDDPMGGGQFSVLAPRLKSTCRLRRYFLKGTKKGG